jgi:hypothetical protein
MLKDASTIYKDVFPSTATSKFHNATPICVYKEQIKTDREDKGYCREAAGRKKSLLKKVKYRGCDDAGGMRCQKTE